MEDKQTEELIEELTSSGLGVSYELAEEIRRRPDADLHLVRLLEDERYWDPEGPGEGWAPIHAIHLLSAIGSEKGLKALEDVLRKRPDDLGDWLTEECAALLANFGGLAIPTLMELATDRELDIFVRNAAIRALVVLAHRRPEFRQPTIDLFLKLMEEKNKEFLALNALEFAQLKDPLIFERLKSLFKRELKENPVCTFRHIEEVYASPERDMDYHRDEEDPMEHFKPENLRRLKGLSEEWAGGLEGPSPRVLKVGRNDPCPCGSGKKYKKCCWPKAF